MNPIFNALSGGYSATQIINFIQSFIPKLTPKINAAKKQGYSAEKIVEFLSDTMQSEANSSYQTSNRIHAKNREENKQLTKDLLKQGLNLGATAIGANVLSKMVPNLGRMINARANINSQNSPNIPQAPANTTPPPALIRPTPTQGQNIPPPPAHIPNPAQPGPNIGQQIGQQAAAPVNQSIQPNQPTPQNPNIPPTAKKSNPAEILQKLGIKDRVDALRESNPPEVIPKILLATLPNNVSQALKQQNIPIDQLISEYVQTAPPPETLQAKQAQGVPFGNRSAQEMNQNETQNTPLTSEITPNIPYESGFKDLIEKGNKKFQEHMKSPAIPEKPKDISLKLDRGSTVLLPDGEIGEIEDVKQGIAKIKVGDKIRNKKLSELMESPKEAATAALELIKSFTPEHHRSSHHALNTYDPTTKSAQFLFHNGEGYIIDDISPEEYERLSTELDVAKTTGETEIGAWATGSGSRGAAYQKIVKNLKKPYRKIQVGYNLFKEFQRLINEKEE